MLLSVASKEQHTMGNEAVELGSQYLLQRLVMYSALVEHINKSYSRCWRRQVIHPLAVYLSSLGSMTHVFSSRTNRGMYIQGIQISLGKEDGSAVLHHHMMCEYTSH